MNNFVLICDDQKLISSFHLFRYHRSRREAQKFTQGHVFIISHLNKKKVSHCSLKAQKKYCDVIQAGGKGNSEVEHNCCSWPSHH